MDRIKNISLITTGIERWSNVGYVIAQILFHVNMSLTLKMWHGSNFKR